MIYRLQSARNEN